MCVHQGEHRMLNVVAFLVVDTKNKLNVHQWEMSVSPGSLHFIEYFKLMRQTYLSALVWKEVHIILLKGGKVMGESI